MDGFNTLHPFESLEARRPETIPHKPCQSRRAVLQKGKRAVQRTARFCQTLLNLERSEINALRSVALTQVR